MSKNLGLLQNGSGKIGNVVLQRNNVQRVRKRQINNPRTQAQQISRMIAATATRTYSALKGIVDHSFQGISYGGKSMNYFLKNAMRDLRNYAAQWQDGQPENEGFGYSPKYRYGAVPGEFLVSKGTLPHIGGASSSDDKFQFAFANLTTDFTPANLASLGVQPGDQITFLCIDCSNENVVVRVSRLVLNNVELTGNLFTAEMVNNKTTSALKSYLVDPGNQEPKELNAEFVFGLELPITVGVGCIILSRPVGDTWGRSTERLAWAGALDDWSLWGDYLYNNALETWMEGGVTVGESDRYLNEGV